MHISSPDSVPTFRPVAAEAPRPPLPQAQPREPETGSETKGPGRSINLVDIKV